MEPDLADLQQQFPHALDESVAQLAHTITVRDRVENTVAAGTCYEGAELDEVLDDARHLYMDAEALLDIDIEAACRDEIDAMVATVAANMTVDHGEIVDRLLAADMTTDLVASAVIEAGEAHGDDELLVTTVAMLDIAQVSADLPYPPRAHRARALRCIDRDPDRVLAALRRLDRLEGEEALVAARLLEGWTAGDHDFIDVATALVA